MVFYDLTTSPAPGFIQTRRAPRGGAERVGVAVYRADNLQPERQAVRTFA